jgi:hypothetical protein
MKIGGMSIYGLFMFFLLLVLSDISIAGLRCGTKLVHVGDTKAEVMHKCGEPSFVESWEEEHIQRDYNYVPIFRTHTGRYRWYREPFLIKELIRIEEWTYNFGSTRFMRYLRFENGVLKDMTVGDYGY